MAFRQARGVCACPLPGTADLISERPYTHTVQGGLTRNSLGPRPGPSDHPEGPHLPSTSGAVGDLVVAGLHCRSPTPSPSGRGVGPLCSLLSGRLRAGGCHTTGAALVLLLTPVLCDRCSTCSQAASAGTPRFTYSVYTRVRKARGCVYHVKARLCEAAAEVHGSPELGACWPVGWDWDRAGGPSLERSSQGQGDPCLPHLLTTLEQVVSGTR